MKRLSICFLMILLWPFATAAEERERLLVTGLNFPPYIISDEQRKASGIIVDLISQALDEAGYDVDFQITNWARALAQAKAGNADILIPTQYSNDRTRYFHYPDEPLLFLEQVLIKNIKTTINYDGTMASLAKYNVGKIRKARVHPTFDKAVTDGVLTNIHVRTDIDLLMTAVARMRIDVAGTDRLLSLWSAKNIGVLDHVEIMSPPLGVHPVYAAFVKSRTDVTLSQEVSDILEKHRKNGKTDKILEKYLGNSVRLN